MIQPASPWTPLPDSRVRFIAESSLTADVRALAMEVLEWRRMAMAILNGKPEKEKLSLAELRAKMEGK